MVLAMDVKEPEKGALGVLVGTGVLVGGTREKKVGEGSGVKVGRGVSVTVGSIVGLAVQVAASWRGVGVQVGGALGSTGLSGLSCDMGFMKISTK